MHIATSIAAMQRIALRFCYSLCTCAERTGSFGDAGRLMAQVVNTFLEAVLIDVIRASLSCADLLSVVCVTHQRLRMVLGKRPSLATGWLCLIHGRFELIKLEAM